MKRLILLLALFAAGCSIPIPESMKGYEMYSWQENKAWNFTLITGTNRLKTRGEIVACGDKVENGFVKITVRDVPQVKALLSRVPAEQYVTWSSNDRMVPGFSMPANKVVTDIQKHCESLNLHLQLDK